ncbi:sialate O-acetylesterase [Flavicella marina]|uniref:sialate O-acetylesterase n=1 Tax=Flavicella marina TaxID=1475951 RepID=UPI001264DD2D|nr:sialate O-acetylesterase [Flavicella marina]
MQKINYLLFLLCMPLLGYSQTELASFFSDHMVLQQNENVSIWGTENPKKKITITSSWGETVSTKTDKNGEWNVKLKTPAAGGPYSIEINGSETLLLNDVMIGEVWLCSGQSNMEMPVKGFKNQPVNGSQDAILNGNNKNIRVFSVARNQSLKPIKNVEGNWKVASSKTVGDFSATAYFFGNQIQQTINVPVGLIVTSWGGSRAEAWTDEATLKAFKSAKIPTEIPEKSIQHTPTLLYNAMLHPIVGYTLKGAIWYQGESNKNQASEYQDLITSMVTSWRKQWNQGDFPFYFVQIAPYIYNKNVNSAFLREAQLHTLNSLKNSGMAVTLDIGNKTYIHPAEKKKVGERLAYWALAKDYNVPGIEYSGPVFDTMNIDGAIATITFKNTPNGISSFGKEVTGFEVAGDDKIFHPAKATIIRKGYTNGAVTIESEKVKNPVAVRYNFKNFVEASIFSTAELPASSFRTDNWSE